MKSLQQVIHAVQYELDCSISELSRKLGKSRNYLSTTMKKGLSQEREQQLIEKLLELVDDENAMLRRLINEGEASLIACEKTVDTLTKDKANYAIDIIEKNRHIKEMEKTIATKDLFIDGQDKEIEKLKVDQYNERTSLLSSIKILSDDIEGREKSMEALAKAGHSTGASLRKAETKNRILVGALIGMGLLWAVSAWVMS